MSSNLDGAPDEVLERLYTGAMTAAEGGRLEEAVEMLDQVMELNPNFPDAWWNLGTLRAMLNQHSPALSAWDLYRCMVPDDWRARPKIIQSCQALGDTARRDRERNELLALRRAGADPELAAEPHYCREQFRVGDQPVVAYEVFEPAGPQRVFYTFLVGQPDGMMSGHYSLGSYDFTTNFARHRGRLGPDERYYHLDWYSGPLHATYGFYTFLPSYEQVRAHVVAALTGATRPASYSVWPDTGDRPDTGHSEPSSPAPPAPPPPSASADERAARDPGGAPAGAVERLSSWASRLLGRRDDRAN
ncbi:MAG TPA: tetratricopeptide repeat protein [Longimicrobium sp.]|jgi:tetratricopeptide (TPR) repeat protein|uniref:tetratricopeptide repeat protein n=1 Tax=Longimicrobium sp. TaxID=2029185 RepID=UPI002EDB550B